MVSSSPSSSSELSELKYTPTWVVATVCIIIVAISLTAERVLHYLGKFLKHNRHDALYEALQKLKEELMLLGFISLLLTVFQNAVSCICVHPSLSSYMLPCKKEEDLASEQEMHLVKDFSIGLAHHGQRLLSEGAGSDFCSRQGKVPLLSVEALHQLHIFIFVLAAVHVVFCASTMVLGGAKISQWKNWEEAIRKESEEEDQKKHLKHAHAHHEFVNERAKGLWKESIIMSFLKQFYASVTKSDYRALRSGFIMRHCSSNKNFDFHKYMMRALEDDFRTVVGIRWYLWIFVVIFLLLNVNGWHTYFWLSFLPLIMGDMFKQAIFAEQLRSTLHGWAENARKRKKSGSGISSVLKALKVFGPKTSEDQMQNTASQTSESTQNDRRPAALKGIVASMVRESEIQDG